MPWGLAKRKQRSEDLELPSSRFGGREQAQRSDESQRFDVGEYNAVKSVDETKAGSPPAGEAPAVNRRRRQRDLRATSPDSS